MEPDTSPDIAEAQATSLYAAGADTALRFPPLEGNVRADVAIIGGGYTGLSAALHLAEAGIDVVVIEAEQVGFGASGRNGGQLHSGQRRDQDWLVNPGTGLLFDGALIASGGRAELTVTPSLEAMGARPGGRLNVIGADGFNSTLARGLDALTNADASRIRGREQETLP